MSYSKACCSIPPVASNYSPVGTIENFGDLPVYSTGPKDSKNVVLVFYDIFGFHNNTKQFCDILAKNCGWRVVLPDFFRGNALTEEFFTTHSREELIAWVTANGSLPVVKPDVQRVEEQLKADGAVAGTMVGFCWGAKIASQLTHTESFFIGASLIHPSFVENSDAEGANAPILAIPTKDEPDMTEYMEILYKKPFGSKCQHHRFDDMFHGFCASRGVFDNEENRKRANDAIQLTVNFFSQCFADNAASA
ncbi:alpha/beta-hydrolase [Backusella circina FSU 941]|nr:alpha/beta-hydrolase [Backusella circina FSU 941]